jgi:branched-chain amino acid transport system permease protein
MLMQQLVNGLILGSIYSLFALGFSLVFGVYKILNLAHGAIFMIGAFAGLYFVELGFSFFPALILSMIFSGVLTVLVDLIAFRPLRKRDEIEFGSIIASVGVNLIFLSLAQKWSNTNIMQFPFETFPVKFFRGAGLRISLLQISIICIVAALVALLMFYLYRSSFGRQVRAVAGNSRAAVLLGVSPTLIFMQTFFLSGALAGAAGVLVGLSFNSIHFLMGETFLLKAFVICILGGLGSIPGALVAGLVLGVLETLSMAYMPAGLTDITIYTSLFVILLVRPSGIFGTMNSGTGAYRA